MAAATNTIMTRRTRSPDKTISRKRSDARPFTIRLTADSSAKFASGLIIGRSCGRSAARPFSKPLFTCLDEIKNLVGQAGVGGVDRIHFRHVAVLRQQGTAGRTSPPVSSGPVSPIRFAD